MYKLFLLYATEIQPSLSNADKKVMDSSTLVSEVSESVAVKTRIKEPGITHTNAFSKTSVFILSKTHKKICIHTSVFIAFSTVHTKPRKRINDVSDFENLRFRTSIHTTEKLHLRFQKSSFLSIHTKTLTFTLESVLRKCAISVTYTSVFDCISVEGRKATPVEKVVCVDGAKVD